MSTNPLPLDGAFADLPVVMQPKIAVRPAGDWRDQLICSKGRRDEPGGPKPLLANAITALRAAPEWEGVLAFDEFSLRTVALKPAPWDGAATGLEWTDHEDRLVANWLQHASIYVSVEVAGQSVQTVAKDRPFHPVREYLDSLMWDAAACGRTRA